MSFYKRNYPNIEYGSQKVFPNIYSMISSLVRTPLTIFLPKADVLSQLNKHLFATTSSWEREGSNLCLSKIQKWHFYFYNILLFAICKVVYKSLAYLSSICHDYHSNLKAEKAENKRFIHAYWLNLVQCRITLELK